MAPHFDCCGGAMLPLAFILASPYEALLRYFAPIFSIPSLDLLLVIIRRQMPTPSPTPSPTNRWHGEPSLLIGNQRRLRHRRQQISSAVFDLLCCRRRFRPTSAPTPIPPNTRPPTAGYPATHTHRCRHIIDTETSLSVYILDCLYCIVHQMLFCKGSHLLRALHFNVVVVFVWRVAYTHLA